MGPTTRKTAAQFISRMTLILSLALHSGVALHAQNDLQSRVSKNALSVNIENISIQADSVIHGLTPNFPYPIISTITVFDSNGNFVTDLADTTRWLGPDDIAQIGLPVKSIWSPLIEYHAENHSIPANQDLYQQLSAPLIREILHDRHVPTSTMLVMDVSTSMTEKLDEAKAGARLYIEQIRPVDRAGVILFNHKVVKVQPFTSDKNILIKTIDEAKTDFGTAIYDALMAAIQQTKLEASRPRIIVYTDGRDNNSSTTAEAVIDSALKYHIPIYTICLGDFTIRDILRKIADQTGGLFYMAYSADQMSEIYQRLADLIEHFYLLAHFSPDPIRNNTWRVVDVTVNLPPQLGNYSLRGTGSYFVPGTIPADLSVQLSSITDTSIVFDNQKFNAVMPGQSYRYQMKIKNHGPGRAGYVRLTQILPDSVTLTNTSMQPSFAKGPKVVWQFSNLAPNEERMITTVVHFPEFNSDVLQQLISQVELLGDNDYDLENNRSQDTVYVLYPAPSDLSIQLVSATDTTVMIGDRTFNAVMPGQEYQYMLKIKNNGAGRADNVQISQLLPDSVTFIHATPPPVAFEHHQLFWKLAHLAPDQEQTIAVSVAFSSDISNKIEWLISKVEASADNETNLENNLASDTIHVLYPTPVISYDLAIEQTVDTDSLALLGENLVPVVLAGGMIDYRLTIQNLGPWPARDFVVVNIVPGLTAISEMNPRPASQRTDSLFWNFDSLKVGDKIEIRLRLQLTDTIAVNFTPLFNTSLIVAAEDPWLENNSATTTVYAILPNKQSDTYYDLALKQRVRADSVIVIGGEIFPAVTANGTIDYQLFIENLGPGTAKDFSIQNILPNFAQLLDFDLQPRIKDENKLVWQVDSLVSNDSLTISFQVKVAESLPANLWPLVNIAWLTAENDSNSLNDSTQSTVYCVTIPKDSIESKVDVGMWQTAITDSVALVNDDTLRFVKAGQSVHWILTVINLSDEPARSVRVTNYAPSHGVAKLFQPTPQIITADSISWQFEELPAHGKIQLQFDFTVSEDLPIGTYLFINKALVMADNEHPDFLSNNIAIDTVYCVVKPPLDWQPQIAATPPQVEVGEEITVKVQVPYPVESYDLWVYRADGSIDPTYADELIAT
ncbi:MAG: VWA domain-containing protein, partial [candidate division KSB1 bacterium]|nr:VWA domain-containing protein [candidate division KSB1 bacterium]